VTRVYLHTFGCKANQYDTEVVRQALELAGAEIVSDPARADAAVVNSCTVTHAGEAKMRGLVRRLARRRPDVRTVVMGCAAAVDDGTIAALPNVAGVVGGAAVEDVLSALAVDAAAPEPVLRRFARGSRAWLRIQDGCDEHCTFCATTLARGANRSRPPAEIVAEAEALAAEHEEIVLTGVHIGTYGRDLDPAATLGELTERLVREVPRVRFRLSSIEATEVCDRLADLMVSLPDRLAPHVHAPLQSGSDRLLKRMGRHWYTAATYRARIEALAARLPALGLGADVIVGFPGERAADHAATRALIRDLPYTYLHVFPYSERPSTAAPRLGPPATAEVQRERSAELRVLGDAMGAAYAAARVGGRADVVTTARRKHRFEGLTGDYLPVYLPTDRSVPPRFAARLGTGTDGLLAEPCADCP
jgi:threonylcarbamoyladenosine tRNA methylthiotransferase MtaB